MLMKFFDKAHAVPGSPSGSGVGSIFLVLAATLAGLMLYLWDPLVVRGVRLAQFDQFQRWQPAATPQRPVRVVDIDEATLRTYGQWPWPRSRMAELVGRLHDAGAAVIALDVLLSEPDRSAPAAMARLWQDPRLHAALEGLPDPDAVLARSLEGKPVVLGANLLRQGGVPRPDPSTLSSAPYRIVHSGQGDDPVRQLSGFDSAVWPLPALAASASGVGALNAAPDSDGVVRRVPLLLRVGTQTVPSLSAEALRVAQGARNYVLRSNAAGIQEVRIGALAVPTNAQAEVWLHYPVDAADRLVSAARILQGAVPAEQLRGHLVLVGSSAAGLMDVRTNPRGEQMPGVLAHALALEHMLSGQYLQRPGWFTGLEAVVLVLGSLLVGLVALRAPVRRSALVLGLVLAGLGGGAWYAFVIQHGLLDASNPAWMMALVFGLASAARHRSSERQQRWLREAFSRYVSPNRVAYLLAHPEQLHLGGQRQICSFIFTDLEGFTVLVESQDPGRVEALLNAYLESMLAIVFKHEGTLDRLVGDAMVVLFSAPVAQPDHRQRALDCALEMDAFATAYAQRLQADGVQWGQTRIGVHCGEVTVGNFGGKTLFDYRALGDPINTAARLESVNKHLGTRMCVSQAVLDGCVGIPARAVGRMLLKGKSQPLQVYAPAATLNTAACAPLADYAAAMALVQSGLAHDVIAARAAFEQLAGRYPSDPLVALHLQRLCQGATDDLMVMADK